jgi:hypothetical protein
VVAREEDSFVKLKHATKSTIDLLANIPIFCMLEIPARAKADEHKWELPLCLLLTNNETTPASLQVCISMSCREPSAQRNDKHVLLKNLKDARPQRIFFNLRTEAGAIIKPKFQNMIYLQLISAKSLEISVKPTLTQVHIGPKAIAKPSALAKPLTQLAHWLTVKDEEAEALVEIGKEIDRDTIVDDLDDFYEVNGRT